MNGFYDLNKFVIENIKNCMDKLDLVKLKRIIRRKNLRTWKSKIKK